MTHATHHLVDQTPCATTAYVLACRSTLAILTPVAVLNVFSTQTAHEIRLALIGSALILVQERAVKMQSAT